mgnify:CR=1 FL=1
MTTQQIRGFEIRRVEEKRGITGRRTVADEQLRIEVSGGAVYLCRSTLEAAGGSWNKLHRRMQALSRTHGVPFVERT